MADRYFLDTNVFVYAFDDTAPDKRQRARRLIADALRSQRGVVSWQVVQEFLNVALRKFRTPMSSSQAGQYLDLVFGPMLAVLPSATLYRAAMTTRETTGYSFYDSLIVTAAIEAGCKALLTEDMQSGRSIGQLTIENPFG